MTTKGVVLCDLDGTLASCEHRRHFVDPQDGSRHKDFASFFAGIPFDAVVPGVKSALEAHERDGYKVIYVTARPSSYRRATVDWLTKHGCPGGPPFALLMRATGDNRHDPIVKQDILMGPLKDVYEAGLIHRVYDDRPQVIQMWERHGLDVVHVQDPGLKPAIMGAARVHALAGLPTQKGTPLRRYQLGAGQVRGAGGAVAENRESKSYENALDAATDALAGAEPFEPFPDSVVEQIVYHGTDAKFSEFELKTGKRKIGPFHEYDVRAGGFFFTTSLETAKSYGENIIEAYINIEEPLCQPQDRYGLVGRTVAVDMVKMLMERVDTSSQFPELHVGDLNVRIHPRELEDARWPDRIFNFDGTSSGIKWAALDDGFIAGKMKEFGYDGTSVYDPRDEDGFSWFVIDPSQIRWRLLEGATNATLLEAAALLDELAFRIQAGLRETNMVQFMLAEQMGRDFIDWAREFGQRFRELYQRDADIRQAVDSGKLDKPLLDRVQDLLVNT